VNLFFENKTIAYGILADLFISSTGVPFTLHRQDKGAVPNPSRSSLSERES